MMRLLFPCLQACVGLWFMLMAMRDDLVGDPSRATTHLLMAIWMLELSRRSLKEISHNGR